MSEPNDLSDKLRCDLHLTLLKYDLAGDVESSIHIHNLEERVKAIDWNDRDFIRHTSEMRCGIPVPTVGPPSVAFYQAMFLNLVEKMAASEEAMVRAGETVDRLARYAAKSQQVSHEMYDQLVALGATPPVLPDPRTV